MRPSWATALSTHRVAATLSPRSTGAVAVILPPAFSTSSTVSWFRSASTSQPTTTAPSAVKRKAASLPWPPAVPVIRATLSCRRPVMATLRTAPARAGSGSALGDLLGPVGELGRAPGLGVSLDHAAGPDADVPVAGLGPQRAHGALLPGTVLEGIEVEQAHGVQVGDLVDLVVGHRLQVLHSQLGGLRPRRVGVGVVALPGDVVQVQVMAVLHPEGVVDEAGDDLLVEDLRRQLSAEVLVRPHVVVVVHVVDPLEEVRDPSDAAFGKGDLEVGKLPQNGAEHDVGRGLDDVD